ncbi:MAG TPA: NUDIX hydrolase, partial [Thermoleophilaceae bacterium]
MEIRRLSTRTVYENAWMSVREDRIEWQDGSAGVYGVVDKPDYTVVIPRDDSGIYLVEQFRYPVGGRYWEFPQGSREGVDVEPSELARAELEEETGLRARELRHLGHLYGAYGFCSQGFDVYLATELEQREPMRSVEEQGMRVERFAADELPRMIRDGRIKDAPSIAAYGL